MSFSVRSWVATLVAVVGKRERKRTLNRTVQRRRAFHESLEPRQMLAGHTSFDFESEVVSLAPGETWTLEVQDEVHIPAPYHPYTVVWYDWLTPGSVHLETNLFGEIAEGANAMAMLQSSSPFVDSVVIRDLQGEVLSEHTVEVLDPTPQPSDEELPYELDLHHELDQAAVVDHLMVTDLILEEPGLWWHHIDNYWYVTLTDAFYTVENIGPDPIEFTAKIHNIPEPLNDVTQPGDPIVRVDGQNDGDANDGPPPAAETVENAINDVTQEYLNFLDLGSGFEVTPSVGPTIVSGLRLYTANDAIPRDPASYVLEGGTGGEFTVISRGELALPDARNPGGDNPIDDSLAFQEIRFENDVVYESYRLTFPTLKDAAAANSMQIAEVEILGVVAPVADENPEGGDFSGTVSNIEIVDVVPGSGIDVPNQEFIPAPEGHFELATLNIEEVVSFQSEPANEEQVAWWDVEIKVTREEPDVGVMIAIDKTVINEMDVRFSDFHMTVGTGTGDDFRESDELDFLFFKTDPEPLEETGRFRNPPGYDEPVAPDNLWWFEECPEGDINGDCTVDFADFLILADKFGTIVPPGTMGDIDGNGTVDFTDFLILASNFGQTGGLPPGDQAMFWLGVSVPHSMFGPEDPSMATFTLREHASVPVEDEDDSIGYEEAAELDARLIAEVNDYPVPVALRFVENSRIFADFTSTLAEKYEGTYAAAVWAEEPGEPALIRFKDGVPDEVAEQARKFDFEVELDGSATRSAIEMQQFTGEIHDQLLESGWEQVVTSATPEQTVEATVYATSGAELPQLPDEVRVEVSREPIAEDHHSRGGGNILNSGNSRICTSGFTVEKNGVHGVSTSGHCTTMDKYQEPDTGTLYETDNEDSHYGFWGDYQWQSSPTHIDPAEYFARVNEIRDVNSSLGLVAGQYADMQFRADHPGPQLRRGLQQLRHRDLQWTPALVPDGQ